MTPYDPQVCDPLHCAPLTEKSINRSIIAENKKAYSGIAASGLRAMLYCLKRVGADLEVNGIARCLIEVVEALDELYQTIKWPIRQAGGQTGR